MGDTKPYNPYREPPPGVSPSGSPYRAVIVDDSKMVRQILRQILLSAGFEVTGEFDNGAVASIAIKNNSLVPDFLFVDIEMPLLDGPGFIREVRPLLPRCRIYMVTSHGEKEKVDELLKLGINGYIMKPFDRDTVIARLSKRRE